MNKSKHWILYPVRKNPDSIYRLGDETLESRLTERDLGVLVNSKLNSVPRQPKGPIIHWDALGPVLPARQRER